MLIKKSTEFQVQLNNKNIFGCTALHLACDQGHTKMAEILIQKSAEFKIQLNTKDNFDQTTFHLACQNDHFDLLIQNLMCLIFSKIQSMILAGQLFTFPQRY